MRDRSIDLARGLVDVRRASRSRSHSLSLSLGAAYAICPSSPRLDRSKPSIFQQHRLKHVQQHRPGERPWQRDVGSRPSQPRLRPSLVAPLPDGTECVGPTQRRRSWRWRRAQGKRRQPRHSRARQASEAGEPPTGNEGKARRRGSAQRGPDRGTYRGRAQEGDRQMGAAAEGARGGQ